MTTNFSVNYRNPGHWDIYDHQRRLFCIRGHPGGVIIRDEREPAGTDKRHLDSFATVDAAMAWITSTLMYEPNEKAMPQEPAQ